MEEYCRSGALETRQTVSKCRSVIDWEMLLPAARCPRRSLIGPHCLKVHITYIKVNNFFEEPSHINST